MLGFIKRLFGGGKSDVQALDYREARKLVSSSNGQLVPVPLNPLIWLLGAREKQKGAPLTEAEVHAIRDEAKCVVMPPENANAFFSVLDAQAPVPRIDPERVWVEWQRIRPEIDRYMPR